MTTEQFTHPTYVIRRKVFKAFGAVFHVYDPQGELVFYSKQKAFKLKEDVRLYSDESMSTELLTIQARQIVDFAAAYDIVDTATGQKIGAMKRKGWKSLLRDEWIVMDANDQELARITEDSGALAFVRRFLTNLIPQTYYVTADGQQLAIMKQNFNPFVLKITVDFTPDTQGRFDRRLGIAAAILLAAIEGRQT